MLAQSLLPEWSQYALNARLARALYANGFNMPTPIQAHAIPAALSGHDVIGVAQTVSLYHIKSFPSSVTLMRIN